MSMYFYHYFRWIKFVFRRIMDFINVKLKTKIFRDLFFDREFKRLNVSADIGCGGWGTGLVNLDLYIEETGHRHFELTKNRIKAISNFIISDAQHLPFRDKVFRITRSIHVLEHLPNPLLGLQEMKRIATYKNILCVPSGIQYNVDKDSLHLYTWNYYTFNNLLGLVFDKKRVIQTPYELIGICQQTIPSATPDFATKEDIQ